MKLKALLLLIWVWIWCWIHKYKECMKTRDWRKKMNNLKKDISRNYLNAEKKVKDYFKN